MNDDIFDFADPKSPPTSPPPSPKVPAEEIKPLELSEYFIPSPTPFVSDRMPVRPRPPAEELDLIAIHTLSGAKVGTPRSFSNKF